MCRWLIIAAILGAPAPAAQFTSAAPQGADVARSAPQAEEVVHSPSGNIEVSFRLAERGVPQWHVSREGSTILDWSRLGLNLPGNGRLDSGFTVAGIDSGGRDETYTLVAGKTKIARDNHRELRVRLRQPAPHGKRMDLLFRAFDDGAAFRYAIPEQDGMSRIDIGEEETEFRFPSDMAAWAFQINTFHSSFEGIYEPTTLGAIPDTGEVYPPLTMQRADGVTVAITEADLLDYGGLYLRRAGKWSLRVILPPYPDGSGACVHGSLPFQSPWRVLMIGAKPADLVASTIILDLSTPSALTDVSWIQPGKAIFPWWPDFHAEAPGVPDSLEFENQKYYVDFAAENGIRYIELEPPWYGNTDDCIEHPEKYDITRPVPRLRLPELIAYAARKGVRLFIWAHWDNVRRQGDSAFAIYQKWGAAGVKIDFMNRDDQEMVRWYGETLRKAAAHRLMVLFHGACKPTGLQRTYPNLLSQEGVFGNEQNKVTRMVTPAHTVTIPFTRMLAGPMDFTPGGFRNATAGEFRPDYRRPMVMGTRCHQLAMFVVYESPLMMVCDDPAAYRGETGLAFIREVPVTWDETRAIEGAIGKFILLARRSGQDWYIGGMTDWTARDFSVPLTFLEEGRYGAEVYADAPDADAHPRHASVSTMLVKRGDTLPVHMAQGGGLAVRLVRLADR